MPVLDTINRAFRDHVRYTGDGLPGAPVGAPLPTGDPRSGTHQIQKAEARQALIEVAQVQGDPGALDQIQTEVARKANASDTTPSYPNRNAAVAAVAVLPGAISQILVREGSHMVERSRTASADDPLFPSGARWGVVARYPSQALINNAPFARLNSLDGSTGDVARFEIAEPFSGVTNLLRAYFQTIWPGTNTVEPIAIINGETYRIFGTRGESLRAGEITSSQVITLRCTNTPVGGNPGSMRLASASRGDHVGLGNVDNTSDANKPLSTPQGFALTTALSGLGWPVTLPSPRTDGYASVTGGVITIGGANRTAEGFTVPAGADGTATFFNLSPATEAAELSGRTVRFVATYEATPGFLAGVVVSANSFRTSRSGGSSAVRAIVSRSITQEGTRITQVVDYVVDATDTSWGPHLQITSAAPVQASERSVRLVGLSMEVASDTPAEGRLAYNLKKLLGEELPDTSRVHLPMTDMRLMAGWGSSTMRGLGADLATMAAELGAEFYPGGDGGTTGDLALARMGAVPARLTFPGNSIPASGMVEVACSLLHNTNIDPFLGCVSGVEGTLTAAANSVWLFSRTRAGKAVVATDQAFYPVDANRFSAGLHFLNLGKNDLVTSITSLNSPARILEMYRTASEWIPTRNKRCLMIGHYVNRDVAAGAAERGRIATVNAGLADDWGGIFVDIASYLAGAQVWTDTGISPTADDGIAQQDRRLPPSLTTDGVHMNSAANRALIQHVIKPRLIALGWYQEWGPPDLLDGRPPA